ncbi:MAG: hypothetical protein OEY14_05130, partial [Myxococcales bacterium]|nr:hypothetical protein [Myxococcales bacterium]
MMPVRFSYWSDPLCIWAFVGQKKLDDLLEEFGDRFEVVYRVVPVFGSVSWRFREGAWARDGIEGRVRKTREIALANGHPEVQGEVWARSTPSSSWAPGAAIKAVFSLEAEGKLDAGQGATY